MTASDTPGFGDREWNTYRAQVIATVTDVELDIAAGKFSINAEGMTCEVAERMKIGIDTQVDFDIFHAMVKQVRRIGIEAVRAVREDQGGQFSLF